MPDSIKDEKTQYRAQVLLQSHLTSINVRTDRLFAGLLIFQWLIGIGIARVYSPQAWAGASADFHPHIWAAVLLGGISIIYPIILVFLRPGKPLTRHVIAIAQMLTSSLLIHLTGGRVETHFHIFGSLAFLAFYRDWRVLITASVITTADHVLRGILAPLSIYGVQGNEVWRWVEHAGWVVFEDVFLIISILQSRKEMQYIASRQAQLETINASIEATVVARTRELQESQDRYEIAINGSSEGIWDWDITTGQIYCSLRFWQLVGLDLGATTQHIDSFHSWLHPDDRNRVHEGLMAHLERDLPYAEDFRLRGSTGDYRWFHARGRALRDEQGTPYRMAGSMVDITDRRLLETQLAHAQKMESIGQLAAGIAHEINTPIQYIGDNVRFLQESFHTLCGLQQSFAQLHQDCNAADVQSASAKQIDDLIAQNDLDFLLAEVPLAIQQSLDGLERVTGIVRAMKYFSHPGGADKTPVNINQAIESTITVARHEWKYVANVVTEFDPKMPLVPCLPGDFNQVVLNLLVNAAHAIADVVKDSGARGTITVTTRYTGDWAEVRVRDTGTGIPEGIRSRIFDPFFTTKRVGKGTGQGLSIAHSIMVDRHEGQIDFETEMGVGTTFILRLPLAAGESVQMTVEQKAA
jgi:PAS domain S-box-containing protein